MAQRQGDRCADTSAHLGPGRQINYATLASPVGELLVTAGQHGVTAIYLEGSCHAPPSAPEWRRDPALFGQPAAELAGYFLGLPAAFAVPLDVPGTSFQLRVWEARSIPYGGGTASWQAGSGAPPRPGPADWRTGAIRWRSWFPAIG